MADIVDIDRFRPKKPDLVFECPCDGQLFYLNIDGSIECRNCKMIIEKLEWFNREEK